MDSERPFRATDAVRRRTSSQKGQLAALAGLIACILFTNTYARPAPDAPVAFIEAGQELILQAPGWHLVLDSASGTIRRINDCAAQGTLLRGAADLWVIERHKAPDITSSTCAFNHAWDEQRQELVLTFDGSGASVTILCKALSEGPQWQAQVQMKQGTMVGWRFPVSVEFDAEGLTEFVLPDHLGLAFTRAFFEPGGAGVDTYSVGPDGLKRVAGDRCHSRPWQDEAVAVRPGSDAETWLPQWYLKEMPGWKVVANRCPADGKHDLSLVETEHGCWLSGYQLGGWGWLFRFGGRMEDSNSRPQVASVIATLTHLYHTPPSATDGASVPAEIAGRSPGTRPMPPRCIGLVVSRPTGQPGVRRGGAETLRRELERQDWLKSGGIEIVELPDAEGLRAALRRPREWFAILNTLAEGFPAESPEQAGAMLDAIHTYVRDGGIWWDTGGGYSFYRAVVPAQSSTFSTSNRAFCDFAALSSSVGHWTLFGVQRPDAIYVPTQGELATGTGAWGQRIGRYSHRFHAFAGSDQQVTLPVLRMVIGTPHRQVLDIYGKENGFARGLTDKADPKLIEALKRCILLKVTTGRLTETTQVARELPFPVLFHIVDYLRGGFDKQYPDHLPPHPDVGTGEDLAELVRACREKGHVLMPYTNPTWWCVNPKGPTFERVGDVPLSRTLDGELSPESYGSNSVQGYTICAWHPAVRAANDVVREQFTRQYPVDVLFQDQVGARGHRFDTNPAAPHPGAYLEGIHRIAKVDSEFVPLGTEDGHDRLINCELMFCGLSFPWLPNRPLGKPRVLYEDLWMQDAWRIEPLTLFLAHDKALFYHHDLGGFVRDRLDLSLTLVMGFGLSWWTHTAEPKPEERDWIERLCRVQAAVGPRCAGRPLSGFEYLATRVIRSHWGDLEIVANLTAEPWALDASTVVAPEGFAARAPDLEAGIFTQHPACNTVPGVFWLIRERTEDGWTEWTAQVETQGR